VTLTGTATAGSMVYVYADTKGFDTVYANSQGVWTSTVTPRTEGQHVFTAQEVKDGKLGAESNSWVVNVDIPNQAPAKATVDYIEDNYQYSQNIYSNGNHLGYKAINDSTPTLHGSGVAGQIIYFKQYDDYNTVGSVKVNSGGHWTFTAHVSDPDGPYGGSASVYWDLYSKNSSGQLQLVGQSDVVSYFQASDYTSSGPVVDNASGVHASLSYITGYGISIQDARSEHMLETLSPVETHKNEPAQVELPQSNLIETHDNSLQTLTLNDILSEAHDNLFIQDGHKQLAVTGDAGDVVELKVEDLAHNTWQDAGQVTAGGVQYEVYQHAGSNVELLVQQGVELHQVS
jgi:hypothetical protein